MDCSQGKYQTKCSGRNDAKCDDCRPSCGQGEFESVACTALTNRNCTRCTQCQGNYYNALDCTATSDTFCMPCSIGTDTNAINRWLAQVDSTNFKYPDGYCILYSGFGTTCQAGEYETQGCKRPSLAVPVEQSKRICPAGNKLSWWHSDRLPTNVLLYHADVLHTCAPCSARCPGFVWGSPETSKFEVQACSGGLNAPSTDRRCQTCKLCNTVPGDKVAKYCTETQDTVCASDVKCSCPQGQYALENCIMSTCNQQYAGCYLWYQDAYCLPWTSTTCERGFYKHAPPSATSDIDCRMCPQDCPDGHYQVWPPRNTSNLFGSCPFECVPCSSCPRGMAEKIPCTPTNNTVCGECDACEQQQYKVEDCWGKRPALCRTCSTTPQASS